MQAFLGHLDGVDTVANFIKSDDLLILLKPHRIFLQANLLNFPAITQTKVRFILVSVQKAEKSFSKSFMTCNELNPLNTKGISKTSFLGGESVNCG